MTRGACFELGSPMDSTTLLLLPVLVLLVLIVVVRKLPSSLPTSRFLLGVRLIVAAIVLAPAAVRCGPSHVTLNAYSRDVVFWRGVAEQVPAAGGVIMPSHFNARSSDYVLADAEMLRQAEANRRNAEAAARRRGLSEDDVVSAWMKLPRPMSEAEVRGEAVSAVGGYERKAFPMNAAGALGVLLAISSIVGGVALNRRTLSTGDTPKETTEGYSRVSRFALRGAGIGAVAAVLWTVTGADWVPDFGLIVPVLSLGACWPLVRLGRRLRLADVALSDADPEVLAEQRVQRHAATFQARQRQLAAEVATAVRTLQERTTYLASLQATAPGSPAILAAESAVQTAQAHVASLELQQAAPGSDFAGELSELQWIIRERRKNVAVLASGGGPPEVIAAAEAAIDELRSRFRDLADRAGDGRETATAAQPASTSK